MRLKARIGKLEKVAVLRRKRFAIVLQPAELTREQALAERPDLDPEDPDLSIIFIVEDKD